MMLHDFVLWMLWTLATAGEPMVRTDYGLYDGPLVERRITEPLPWYGSSFIIDADSPELAGFERWLRRHPIHVRAPGHQYIGWGLLTFPGHPGEIKVTCFNLLLTSGEQPLGPYIGHGGDMLAWAFSVLDHYQLPYSPEKQLYQRSRAELIQRYGEQSDPIDWHEIADLLRSTGRAVPADLFDQPTR
jgi:hypothetical protein